MRLEDYKNYNNNSNSNDDDDDDNFIWTGKKPVSLFKRELTTKKLRKYKYR